MHSKEIDRKTGRENKRDREGDRQRERERKRETDREKKMKDDSMRGENEPKWMREKLEKERE